MKHSDGSQSLIEGTAAGLDLSHPDAGDPGATVVRTGHAFIDDKAFTAAPVFDAAGNLLPDADNVAGNVIIPNAQGQLPVYDDELLNAHYVAGDGRVNENIGLTAVHEVFHNEHNRLIEQVKDIIRGELSNGDTSFATDWVLPGADLSNGIQDNEWNGERLFQVAKFGTETQYQHLVFEEFARKIAPTIHLFGNTDIHLDPAITAEFAHAVYRFGHSMLDESLPRFELNADGTFATNPDGSAVDDQIALLDAFTNPLAYLTRGVDAAGEIVQGTTHQIGSEIDEFVTGTLRNNLLGLPLDLPALNIARGRDTGVPPINLLRNEIYAQTHDATLKPYDSWHEFGQFLKHPASLINFVAAYGTEHSILAATTLVDKRAAALDLVTMGEDPASQTGDAVHQNAYNFMHSLGAYANDLNSLISVHATWSTGSVTGLDNVDLWIGGLAEKQNLFGGLLGSTFNFIFETQLENLQDADRLYYLPRIEGIHFGSEIEANSFASLIMENTGASDLMAKRVPDAGYTIHSQDVSKTDPSTWLHNPVAGNLLVREPFGTPPFTRWSTACRRSNLMTE